MKKGILGLTILSLGFSMISPCTSLSIKAQVNESEQEFTSYITEEEEVIREQYQEDGISQELADKAIGKLKRGEELDCDNEEKVNSISGKYFTFNVNSSKKEKTYIFDDGSYVKCEIKDISKRKAQSTSGISTRSIEVSHYGRIVRDEWIQVKKTTFRMGFYCSFDQMSGYAKIIACYGFTGWGLSDWSYGDVDIIRKQYSIATGPALAVAIATQKSSSGLASKTGGWVCSLKVSPEEYKMTLVKK